MAATSTFGPRTGSTVPVWIDHAPAPTRQPRPAAATDRGRPPHRRRRLHRTLDGHPGQRREPRRAGRDARSRSLGHAASGRNGGFCSPSLTHGLSNGLERWPKEIDTLVRLGLENLREIAETIANVQHRRRLRITGKVAFARTAWEAEGLKHAAEAATAHGDPATLHPAVRDRQLDHLIRLCRRHALRELRSRRPVQARRSASAGSASSWACRSTRTRPSLGLDTTDAVQVDRPHGDPAPCARPASPSRPTPSSRCCAGSRLVTIPVYDYAIVTEPLTDEQFASIGWTERLRPHRRRQPVSLLPQDGGWPHPLGRLRRDLPLRLGARRRPHPAPGDLRQARRPVLRDLPAAGRRRASRHKWGGIVDSSTRFCLTTGTAAGGRIAYALGFTGLGVTATRFGGQVMLDLLAGRSTERTRLTHDPTPAGAVPARARSLHRRSAHPLVDGQARRDRASKSVAAPDGRARVSALTRKAAPTALTWEP